MLPGWTARRSRW